MSSPSSDKSSASEETSSKDSRSSNHTVQDKDSTTSSCYLRVRNNGVATTVTLPPPRLHHPRGRGRPSKAELQERERDRQDQVTKMFEERGEFYSLVLVGLNRKLAIQNGLWKMINTNKETPNQ